MYHIEFHSFRLTHLSTTKLCKALKKHTLIRDPATSANVAYGQVTSSTSYTEDINTIADSSCSGGGVDGSVGEDQPHPMYEDINYNALVD